jgi:hypothetical protein
VQWVNDGEYKYLHYQRREVFPLMHTMSRLKPTVTIE